MKAKQDGKMAHLSYDKLYINNRKYTVRSVVQSGYTVDCTIVFFSLKQLQFLSWNVQGIRSKLDDQDFLEYISKFDVLIFTETWHSKITFIWKVKVKAEYLL